MQAPSRQSAGSFREGAVASVPVAIAVMPVAMLFGAVAVNAGLTALDATLMSALMFAGASQFVAIDLFGQAIPAWSILLSVLAVNFRHVLYSAALTPAFRPLRRATKAGLFPLLIDPVFAFMEKRLAEGRGFCPAAYLGMGLVLYANWVLGSAAGAVFGQFVADPEALSLDMILPIYFLTLVVSFRARANWGIVVAASGTLSVAVYHAPALGLTFLGPPWHITIGAAGGILAAVLAAARGRPVPVDEAAQEETFEAAAPPREEVRR